MISPAPSLSAFLGQPANLLDRFLAEQQSLTAVDRFSAHHDKNVSLARPTQERYYRNLLPLNTPGPDEQFAFEVDLDRCSGCKACVTACHSLNGLEDGETWRHVGLLHDPSSRRMQQTITTTCHHCLEPSCAEGCPTLAYEKDPATGIVRHLDDQCFGCQYCILKCPYDVPQYSQKKGIVRKCDMCIGRLSAGEAPACVQACPTQAIRIVLTDKSALRLNPKSGLDLPGTPNSSYTLPTTRYVSRRGIPENLAPVDAHQLLPEQAHLPLVFMLVASQTAIGYWILHAIRNAAGIPSGGTPRLEIIGLVLVLAMLALGPLHLGRPWLAWKAFLNWRRSWLSREIIAFSAFAGAATVATLAAWKDFFAMTASILAALAAIVALYSSTMVYRDTPRMLWATRGTLWRFSLTSVLCGGAAYLAVIALTQSLATALAALLPAAQFSKLALEAKVLRHRDDEEPGPLWKAAHLLSGRFGLFWRWRVVIGLVGGVCFPIASALGIGPSVTPFLILPLLIAGELMERTLFFTTAVAPRMPGGR